MKQVKMLLILGALASALVLSTACGAPSTPVTPTSAATATTVRAVPTLPPPTATRPPTVAPTPLPSPTLAPTAVLTPPTPTKPPATATRTRAPATKAPAVTATKPATATPTPECTPPNGKAGLLIRNFFGQALFYTLPGRPETRIEGNTRQCFTLDPGSYVVTVSVPGQFAENRTFTLSAGDRVVQDYYAR